MLDKILDKNIREIAEFNRRHYKDSLFIRMGAIEQYTEALRSERGDILNYLDRQFPQYISDGNRRKIFNLTLTIEEFDKRYEKLERQIRTLPL